MVDFGHGQNCFRTIVVNLMLTHSKLKVYFSLDLCKAKSVTSRLKPLLLDSEAEDHEEVLHNHTIGDGGNHHNEWAT